MEMYENIYIHWDEHSKKTDKELGMHLLLSVTKVSELTSRAVTGD